MQRTLRTLAARLPAVRARPADCRVLRGLSSNASSGPWSFRDSGAPDTVEFRKFMVDPEGRFRSPWHDVPLRPDPERKFVLNYVNEIPKGTTAKMEIATDEEFNPIKQDTKRGVLRYFKAGNIPFNYGCLPRTWEKPSELHAGFPGDNDPVDLVELSREPIATGTVLPVKVLSAIALIDQGEIDWKIIGIALGSDLADSLHDIHDLRGRMPGELEAIREWFRTYKVAEGKAENSFLGDFLALDEALAVINGCVRSYEELREGKVSPDGLWVPAAGP